MKKLRNRERQIRLSIQRFEKKLIRKAWVKLLKEMEQKEDIEEAKQRRREASLKLRARKNKFVKLDAPSIFSLIENPNETILFFEKINHTMLKYRPVFINMSNINKMTADALVYYIAVLQKLKETLTQGYLKGAFPKNEKVLTLMRRSGFLNYFQTDADMIQTHKNYIEIQTGNFVNSGIAKKVCIFVQDKLNLSQLRTRHLYDIILELMLNTKHHAYNGSNEDYSNWIIFSRFVPDRKKVDFIFMDTGYGIPETVRKGKLELASKYLSKLGILEYNESDLIYSALKGAFRSQTGHIWRGKGLPKIFEYYKDKAIRELNILSNKACVTPDERYDLETKMIGTLFYWAINEEDSE